jgi:hypothetical protein
VSGTPLVHGFFHTFQIPERVPVITCFFNALQYNRTLNELRAALRNIHANLSEGGICIFDILCSLPSHTVPYPVFQVKEFSGEGLRFSRTFVGVPTAEGFQSTMHYVVFDGVSTEVITGTTLRGVYSVEEMKRALLECSFNVLYDGPGYAPAPVLTVFVAQKQNV